MSKKEIKEKDQEDGLKTPHDSVFKNTFCNKEAMLDFLGSVH